MEDSVIIELINKRDESAIEACLLAYGKLLHSIAYNILGSKEDAEECVQDALHKLWDNPPQCSAALRGYLAVIVRNIALLRIRGNTTQKRGGSEYPSALDEFCDCIPANCDVEAEAEARELARIIGLWLMKLPVGDRVLFVRRYRFGDPVSLIADELGISPARVSKRLYNLREKLRKYLIKEKLIK